MNQFRIEDRWIHVSAFLILFITISFCCVRITTVHGQTNDQVARNTEPLIWDSLEKETTAKTGQTNADFVFTVTNMSDQPVIINNVETSCGCTTAKIPSRPWVIAAHTDGRMQVSVNLVGRWGTFSRDVMVVSQNLPFKILHVKVIMPNAPEVNVSLNLAQQRSQDVMMSLVDRQAVFKGDCAKCHAEPTKGKMERELYLASCGICHEAKQRASMVPNLRALNHPTDAFHWRKIITSSKPGTLMPAFGQSEGGPLTEAQIESLVVTLSSMSQTGSGGPRQK
jgi:hypothetical protein